MNNITNLSSEYATVNEKGEVRFEKEGEKLCLINTEVLMMRNGKIIFNGTDEQLLASDNEYVKRFIRGER
jgi:ABC-type transporter Mla maintaining outer membrane lipid asymmetry ATPase subunit MlaF